MQQDVSNRPLVWARQPILDAALRDLLQSETNYRGRVHDEIYLYVRHLRGMLGLYHLLRQDLANRLHLRIAPAKAAVVEGHDAVEGTCKVQRVELDKERPVFLAIGKRALADLRFESSRRQWRLPRGCAAARASR